MNLTIKSQTFAVPEDHTWMGSKHGTDIADPITLDSSLFLVGTFPAGLVKSGTVLAKITATGKYAPYKSDASGGQELPIGVLMTTVDLTGGIFGQAVSDSPAALLWHGELIAAKMPMGTGASSTTPGALDSVVTTFPAAITTAQQQAVVQFNAKFRIV